MHAIAGPEPKPARPPRLAAGFEGSALARWFRAQADGGRRIAYLEDALITGRFGGYAAYRLRFFFMRVLAAAVLHGVKFALLYSLFAPDAFRTLLWLHAVAGLAGSFWWGGLEVMRDRVRRLARAGRPKRIPLEIHFWTGAASLLAIAIVVGAAAALAISRAGFDVARTYALTVVLGLALDLVTLAFHSGIYAIRRIYRPLGTIVGVEAVGLAAVVALVPWIGAWSLPVAMMAANVTSAAFVLHYTSRLYRFFGFRPFGWPSLRGLRSIGRRGAVDFVAAGSAYALLKLDAVLVLSLFRAAPLGPEVTLFALFYAVAPTIQAGFDWAQLFYFDLKRLESEAFANLKGRYEHFVGRLSWAIGACFWILACVSGSVLLGRNLGIVYLLLLPFFLSRSALAFAQIRSFSSGRYRELLTSGLWLLGGMLLLRTTVADERVRLAALPILAFAAMLSLRRAAAHPEPSASGEVLPFLVWLRRAARCAGPMRIRSIVLAADRGPVEVAERAAEALERQIGSKLVRRLRGHGEVTVTCAGRIVWWEIGDRGRAPSDAWLFCLGRGLVESLFATETVAGGRRAIERARALGLLPSMRDGDVLPDESALVAEFRGFFPEGVVHDVDDPAGTLGERLDSRERRSAYAEAAHFARDLETRRTRLPFEVTAYCAAEDLRLVFLVDRRVPRWQRARWTERVRRANLQAAFAAIR